jgi:hypothetical protein
MGLITAFDKRCRFENKNVGSDARYFLAFISFLNESTLNLLLSLSYFSRLPRILSLFLAFFLLLVKTAVPKTAENRKINPK